MAITHRLATKQDLVGRKIVRVEMKPASPDDPEYPHLQEEEQLVALQFDDGSRVWFHPSPTQDLPVVQMYTRLRSKGKKGS